MVFWYFAVSMSGVAMRSAPSPPPLIYFGAAGARSQRIGAMHYIFFFFLSIWRPQLWWVDIHWVTLSCDCSLVSQLLMTSCMTLAGTRPGPEYISWDRQTDGSLPHCASLGRDRSVKQPLFNTWVFIITFYIFFPVYGTHIPILSPI